MKVDPRKSRLQKCLLISVGFGLLPALQSCAPIPTIQVPATSIGQDALSSGALALRQGRYLEAESFFQRSVSETKDYGPQDLRYADSLFSLGHLYYVEGRYREAEPMLHQSLRILEDSREPQNPEVISILHRLGDLESAMGHANKAKDLYSRAIDLIEKSTATTTLKLFEYPDLLGKLALLCQTQKRYKDAESLYGRAVEFTEKSFGKNSPEVARRWNDLGMLYQAQSRWDKAEALYRKALTTLEADMGLNHPDVIHSRHNFALFLQTRGNTKEACEQFQKTLTAAEQVLDTQSTILSSILEDYAALLRALGRIEESDKLMARVSEARSKE